MSDIYIDEEFLFDQVLQNPNLTNIKLCTQIQNIKILHRLLGALLSKELSVEEKLNIIEKEYDIPVESSIRKDVSVMCNLSQGIEEYGIAIGKAEGKAEIIVNMYKKGFALEQIADVTDKDIEEVKTIIENKEAVPV